MIIRPSEKTAQTLVVMYAIGAMFISALGVVWLVTLSYWFVLLFWLPCVAGLLVLVPAVLIRRSRSRPHDLVLLAIKGVPLVGRFAYHMLNR